MPKAKKTNIIKETDKKESNEILVNYEDLIAKTVADALKKQEELLRLEFENKNKENNLKEPVKTNMFNRNFIPDDARIRVQSNVEGKFIIKDVRGNGYFVELDGYGDSQTIAYKELKTFNSQYRSFLAKGKIVITDVISDNGTSIEDVLRDFNLDRLYTDETIIRPFEIEKYLTSDISFEEFTKKIEKSIEFMEVIVESAIVLFKRGAFSDNNKMNKIRELYGEQKLFTN